MKDFGTLFDQIRAVREARNQFLALWRRHVLRQLATTPAITVSGLDRLLADIARNSAGGTIRTHRSRFLYLDEQMDDEG